MSFTLSAQHIHPKTLFAALARQLLVSDAGEAHASCEANGKRNAERSDEKPHEPTESDVKPAKCTMPAAPFECAKPR